MWYRAVPGAATLGWTVPAGCGVAALAGVTTLSQGEVDGVADAPAGLPVTAGERQRRRRRGEGGRHHRHEVKVTLQEEALLRQLAVARRVSVPRLLVESAIAGGVETASERHDAIEELFKVHRLLAKLANNVNQIARAANASASDAKAPAPRGRRLLAAASFVSVRTRREPCPGRARRRCVLPTWVPVCPRADRRLRPITATGRDGEVAEGMRSEHERCRS